MQVEIFTLCDAATVSGGKLNILGSFDTLAAMSFPCRHPVCAVATKIRFDLGEEGDHTFEIHFCDPDMRQVLEPLKQSLHVEIPNERSHSQPHIWSIFGFEMTGPGEYYFEIKVDGETQVRIPLYVMQVQQQPG